MNNRSSTRWLGSLGGLSALVLAWVGFASPLLAQSVDNPELGKPSVMDVGAVTLELRFNPGTIRGNFQPLRCKVITAEIWAGGPAARADVQGFSGLPGAKAFKLPGAGGLRGERCHRSARNVEARGRCRAGTRYELGKGRHPIR